MKLSEFKKAYRIESIYEYKDKKNWKDMVCISAIPQVNYKITSLKKIFLTKTDFEEIFDKYIDEEADYGFWLVGMYITSKIEETFDDCLSELPE